MILKSVSIEGFLVINSVEIVFNHGLTVISGESGAGKSTIIDAICWCLGVENKRTKDVQGSVTVLFDGPEIITISREGKSLFKLNGKKITKKHLLQMNFMTICRQDHRLSFSAASDFRDVIDGLLDDTSALDEIKTAYINHKAIKDKIDSLKNLCDEDVDYIKNVVLEIESLNLETGDEQTLVLQRREEIEIYKSHESLVKAMQSLKGHGSMSSIVSQVNSLAKNLNSNSPKISELQQRVEHISNELDDIEGSIYNIINGSNSNEARLDMLDKRLGLIRDVARKYRVPPSELQSLLHDYKKKLYLAENFEIQRHELDKRLHTIENIFNTISNNINASRQAVCEVINAKIKAILDELMMGGVEVYFELYKSRSWNEFGDVQIKVNLCKRILSGGEMSRLLLAIKIATATLNIPIIFDEIDLGIGGVTAHKIGNKLRELGRLGQVIVLTHQAQVAAHGMNHVLISRDDMVKIENLSTDARINEIARMISGSQTTNESLLAAKKLLEECTKD